MKYLLLLLLCSFSVSLFSQNTRTSSSVSIGVTVHIDSMHHDAPSINDTLQNNPQQLLQSTPKEQGK